jgi:type IV secretion system protein VirD4
MPASIKRSVDLSPEKITFYALASLFVYQHYAALTEAADERGGRLK